jgi:hypothetical protein
MIVERSRNAISTPLNERFLTAAYVLPIKRSSLRTKSSEVWQSVLRDCFTMFAMTISHTVKIVSRSECYLVIALDCLRWITEGNGDVDNDENLDLVQSSTFSFSNFFHCWKSYKKARKKYASSHWLDARPAFFSVHRTPPILTIIMASHSNYFALEVC